MLLFLYVTSLLRTARGIDADLVYRHLDPRHRIESKPHAGSSRVYIAA